MIPFYKPCYTGDELSVLKKAMAGSRLSGDSQYTKLCSDWFENYFNCSCALLTPSCTHALEMVAMLMDIKEGDEIIMPSYTFVSSANAFVKFGARIRFVDVCPRTMNIDEKEIEKAITNKTKAVLVVHYASLSCDMDVVQKLCMKNNLILIEDAAQAIHAKYKEKLLGTFGDFATFSFHDTKKYY